MFEFRDGGQHCDHESGHDVALGSPKVVTFLSQRSRSWKRMKTGVDTSWITSTTRWWLNQPIWKICSSKWESSPNRGENKKSLKPPPSLSISNKWVAEVVYLEDIIPGQDWRKWWSDHPYVLSRLGTTPFKGTYEPTIVITHLSNWDDPPSTGVLVSSPRVTLAVVFFRGVPDLSCCKDVRTGPPTWFHVLAHGLHVVLLWCLLLTSARQQTDVFGSSLLISSQHIVPGWMIYKYQKDHQLKMIKLTPLAVSHLSFKNKK